MNNSLTKNEELALLFHKMSDCYRFLGPEERFRANAYDQASKTLSNLQEPVENLAGDIKKLDDLKGVGESIAEKIREYITTGHVGTFEKLKKAVPYDLLELLDVGGIGPSTLRMVHQNLGINSKEAFIEALEKGKLDELEGFGPKKVSNLRQVLKLNIAKKRLPLDKAQRMASVLSASIEKIPGVKTATVAGSIRRKKETIGDIDIILTAERSKRKGIAKRITQLPGIKKILAAGSTKISVILKNNVQADIRIVDEMEYGAALFYFTGSKEHNIQLRTIARKKGWKINEYGVFEEKNGKRLAGRTEEEIYSLFGLPYIPPENRLGKNELDAAR